MRDDERYPTAVLTDDGYHDAPEVVSQPPLDYEGRDKFAAGTADGYKADGPPAEVATKQRRCCGMKRKTFFIVLAVVLVVVIGGVVGGAVGGLKAGGLLGNKSDPDPGSGSDPDPGDKPSPTSSGPIKPSQRAITVSSSSGDEKQDMQVFYQDLATPDILFRRVKNDQGQAQHTVKLTIKPNRATPLAAAAVNGTDPIVVQVFYTALDDNNNTAIAQARLECATNTDECDTKSNSLLPSDVVGDVHEETKLAALRFGKDAVRVFYQTGGGTLQALSGKAVDSDDWSTYRLAVTAQNGTAVAVSAVSSALVNFFFVSYTGVLRRIEYNDLLGPGKSVSVDDTPGSEWSRNASLASTVNTTRCFYAKPSDGTIVSYFQTDENPTLNINHDPSWGIVDGGLAITTWSNRTRMFYFTGNALFMSAQDGPGWKKRHQL